MKKSSWIECKYAGTEYIVLVLFKFLFQACIHATLPAEGQYTANDTFECKLVIVKIFNFKKGNRDRR